MDYNTQNNNSQNREHDTQIINGQVVAGHPHTRDPSESS